jgi:cell division protein FtsI/penicillin-binding protein 2
VGAIDSDQDPTARRGGLGGHGRCVCLNAAPPHMPPATRIHPAGPARSRGARWPALVVLLLAVALVAGGAYVLLGRDDGPTARDALDAFAASWSRGDDRGAAAATTRPAVAAKTLRANRRGLDGATLRASVIDVAKAGDDGARGRLRLAWQVPQFGRFAYTTGARLRRDGDQRWHVVWDPKVVHPALSATTRLGTSADRPARAPILDRDGRPLVTARAIARVGVARDRVKDVDATAAAVARIAGVDADAYARAIRAAGPRQFVEAIALRPDDIAGKRDALERIEGVQIVDDTAQLAPTRRFARALLGTVGAVTAEQLKTLGPAYDAGAQVGQFGLEARFEKRLAGTPARKVVVRLSDGTPDRTLRSRPGTKGRALRTTLDRDVQATAETALGDSDRPAALVAVRPSTGDVLAVANRPSDASFDRALGGRYPPGSTFKIVSTAALLRDGLSPSETVPCPRTINVGGRTFRNFEGEAAGAVPFSRDFAQSCNTAFVSLSARLPAEALQRTAVDFGLGREVTLPLTVAASQVPPGVDRVERAAAMIGQARILASPLQMAGVAATVADGRWRAPRLVSADPQTAGERISDDVVETLRALMRGVVMGGTGTALASLPGAPIGKSGTAEFGPGNPPETHAWFVAARGDLAVAVLVERGKSGGSVAAPIVARFLAALGA